MRLNKPIMGMDKLIPRLICMLTALGLSVVLGAITIALCINQSLASNVTISDMVIFTFVGIMVCGMIEMDLRYR